MLRVKDPQRALDFYTRVLGMRLLPARLCRDEVLALLSAPGAGRPDRCRRMPGSAPPGHSPSAASWNSPTTGAARPTPNAYHDGNATPQELVTSASRVPELDAAVRWFDARQVPYVKRPEQGRMKDVAFIKDPDGYWIEIVEAARLRQLGQ
jgi:lactoylglutathione lyase